MRRHLQQACLATVLSCVVVPMALAQEHFNEGPVWECSSYRTKQGHFDDYMTYLRQNLVPQSAQRTEAGLIMSQKVFLHTPAHPTDPDVVICTLYPSFAKALDYDAEDDAKSKEITAKHFSTADEAKQRELTAKRFAYRDFIGETHYREVNLRP